TALAGGFRGCHRLYSARRRISGGDWLLRMAGRAFARRLYDRRHVARASLLATPRKRVPARTDDQPGARGKRRRAPLAFAPGFPVRRVRHGYERTTPRRT